MIRPSQKKIIVTGGAGYVGSHICKALHSAGHIPIVVDHLGLGHREAVRWGALEVGDIREGNFLDQAFSKYQPHAVIHCAALAYVGESVLHPAKYYQNNLEGTLVLLGAMLRQGITSLIFASSCAVYGNAASPGIGENHPLIPINPYGWTKLMCERMIADFASAYGLQYAILRYFNVAGADIEGEIGEDHDPETHLIPLAIDAAVRQQPFQIYGGDYPTIDGTAVRDYIHVQDVAEAHVRCLSDLSNQTFNLGTGRGYSVLEILRGVERVIQRKIPFAIAPKRAGDPPILVADSGKARTFLGWAPKHSDLDSLIQTAWNFLKEKKYENIAGDSWLSAQV